MRSVTDAGLQARVPGSERPAPVDPTRMIVGWASLGVLSYLVYMVVRPFLLPLGWAAVFAIVIHPLNAALLPRLGRSRAAAASTAAISLALIVPAALILPVFAREALDTAAHIQQAFMQGRFAPLERAWNGLAGVLPASDRVDLPAVLSDAAQRAAAFALAQSGLILRDAALFVFHLVVALFATFFLLRDSALVMRTVRRLLPLTPRSSEVLIARTNELVMVGVTSAVIVATVQGLLGGLVFAILGLEGPVFWGVIMGVFCLLPFGAWLIWLPAAALLAIDGDTTRAIILAALGFAIVSGADNVLRPILVSGRAHVNGLVILVGLLGGVSVFGTLGIVLGPILLATALAMIAPDAGKLRLQQAAIAPSAGGSVRS